MSRLLCHTDERNVITFLLECLAEEEVNVSSLDEDVKQCVLLVNQHTQRMQQLRSALEALGVETTKPQSV